MCSWSLEMDRKTKQNRRSTLMEVVEQLVSEFLSIDQRAGRFEGLTTRTAWGTHVVQLTKKTAETWVSVACCRCWPTGARSFRSRQVFSRVFSDNTLSAFSPRFTVGPPPPDAIPATHTHTLTHRSGENVQSAGAIPTIDPSGRIILRPRLHFRSTFLAIRGRRLYRMRSFSIPSP